MRILERKGDFILGQTSRDFITTKENTPGSVKITWG